MGIVRHILLHAACDLCSTVLKNHFEQIFLCTDCGILMRELQNSGWVFENKATRFQELLVCPKCKKKLEGSKLATGERFAEQRHFNNEAEARKFFEGIKRDSEKEKREETEKRIRNEGIGK